jgi:hypothetical protein
MVNGQLAYQQAGREIFTIQPSTFTIQPSPFTFNHYLEYHLNNLGRKQIKNK